MAEGHRRPAWAEIDQAAMRANAALIAATVGPSQLCAVVKADGYGHGAIAAAKSFLEGGSQWLAVALVEEGIELRRAGIEAPILMLSEPVAGAMEEAVIHGLTPTVYTAEGIAALERAVKRLGASSSGPVGVHVKIDTGMHRVGASPADALGFIDTIGSSDALALEGVWTHLAVADDPDDPYTSNQLKTFEESLAAARSGGANPTIIHAANSAGAVLFGESRYSMVRCGLVLYGYAPSPAVNNAVARPLTPVLSLKARVSYVKELNFGERLSYGLSYELPQHSVVATIPLGYADGVPRSLSLAGGQVLVGGKQCPIAGAVTMDQMMIDCGAGAHVSPGDEVVLIGTQGGEKITAADWATWTGLITYEVLCGIGARVPKILT